MNVKNIQMSINVKNRIIINLFTFDKQVYNWIHGLQAYPIEIDCSDLNNKELIIQLLG